MPHGPLGKHQPQSLTPARYTGLSATARCRLQDSGLCSPAPLWQICHHLTEAAEMDYERLRLTTSRKVWHTNSHQVSTMWVPCCRALNLLRDLAVAVRSACDQWHSM